MNARHRTVLRQYNLAERLPLLITICIRMLLLRLVFYAESKFLFDLAVGRNVSLQRRGRFNSFEFNDDELGHCLVTLRRHTSDFIVFFRCLIERSYLPVVRLIKQCGPESETLTIIDAGANIGMSALYFARAFPQARVIALEADQANYELCCANMKDSALDKVTVLHQALWKEGAWLNLAADFRDGRAWARSVVPTIEASRVHGQSVEGIDLNSLLTCYAPDGVDLLKIDIEGAENQVFESPEMVATWLPKIRFIALEIHNQAGYDLIIPQLLQHGFFLFHRGELTIGVQQRLTTSDRLLEYFRLEPMSRESPIII